MYFSSSFEVVPPKDALLPGFVVNGSWNGIVGQLQRSVSCFHVKLML